METRRTKQRRNSPSSWSNISPKLINSISKLIKSRSNLINFRSVCKNWHKHSVFPRQTLLYPNLPHQIPSSPYLNDLNSSHRRRYHRRLSVVPSAVYLISSNHGNQQQQHWLVMAREINPGKLQLLNPLTGEKFEDPFHQFLDLTSVRAQKLNTSFNLLNSNLSIMNVVLYSTSRSLKSENSLDNSIALVLYGMGVLGSLNLGQLENPHEIWDVLSTRCRLDDIVRYQGMNLVVDRYGRVVAIDGYHLSVTDVIVVDQLIERADGRRKRLVVDYSTKELYLVMRGSPSFPISLKVFGLDSERKEWVRVMNLGDDRVLIVGKDYCCFVRVGKIVGCSGNCVIFTLDAFPAYMGRAQNCRYNDVLVFHLGKDEVEEEGVVSSIEDCLGLSKLIGPPPAWLFRDSTTTSTCAFEEEQLIPDGDVEMQSGGDGDMQSDASEKMQSDTDEEEMQSDSDKKTEPDELSDASEEMQSDASEEIQSDTDKEMQSDFDKKAVSVEQSEGTSAATVEQDEDSQELKSDQLNEDVSSFLKEDYPFIQSEPAEQTERPCTSEKVKRSRSASGGVCNAAQDQADPDCPGEVTTRSGSRTYITSKTRKSRDDTIVKFEGYSISSKLVPTLQPIWSKQGKIIENCMMRNGDVVTMALESLAKMVCILESNSAVSLSDYQASYLSDTLGDLKRMGFKVDWLVPHVEKAITLRKSKRQVDMLRSLRQLESQAMSRRLVLLNEVSKVDNHVKELKANIAKVLKTVPSSREMDLEDTIGAGLS